jgi:pyruvate/2-oxoglutarate dehydrogenase complex dihydrolipoamide acyltransferase (E2) component
MDYEIKANELNQGSVEGTFIAWLKQVGEAVRAGEPIAEVMTEKANIELPSPADGILHAQLVGPDTPFTQETVLGIVRGA